MEISLLLNLLKLSLGISSDAMDLRLVHILDATIKELSDEKGIELDPSNPRIEEFIVSYSKWKYESRSETSGLPRYLEMDLRNLYLHNKTRKKEGSD